MESINSSFDKAKNNNALKKLPQSADFKVEDISCLIDNLPVTVFRASSKLSWGMDYISSNVENLTGYSKMDFIDQKLSWSDIVFPEDISIIDKAVQKAKKNKTSYQVEYRIKKLDGSTAFIQEHAHLICNDKGKLVYKDGLFSEASQIKRKEDTHKAVKEDEEIQLEMFRSFVGKISAGEEIERISGDYTGETKKTVDLINGSIENIMGVLDEIMSISKAGKEGSLSIRSNNSKYPGGWGKLLRELNCALDAIITPLNVAAEYVERISRGDIPEHITDNYKGDFNKIKNNLNNCIDGLQGLVECNNVLQRMAVNDQTKGVEGEYVGIYASMGEATNQIRDHMLNVTKQLNHIAVGNTSKLEELKKIGKRSEQDNLLPAIIKAMEAIDLLIEDTRVLSKMAVEGKFDIRADVSKHRGLYKKIVQGFNDTLDAVVNPMNAAIEDSLMLSEAAVAGKLDIRADVTRHEGNFRKIISGFNDTLDAVIGPLNVTAEYVERISRGEIPEPITDDYRGDFNELKNNLNNCIEGLQGLVECDNVLQRMAVNDQTKEVEGKYVGIYASMGEATNEVRNRLLSVTKLVNDIAVGNTAQLTDLKKVGKRSEQDRLLPAFIGAMENIDLLIEDARMLSRAAVEGKLDTRADMSKHRGEYRKIVEGINDTLDAVIGPLNVAAEYVERISRGDIPEPIKDNYNGDFNEIKNNLNTCIEAINKLIEDSLMLSEAGVAGRYDTRADTTSHEGDFRKIVSGFNDTLDAIVNPMNAAIEDSLMLSEAAVSGRLDIRADVTRHEGNFRKIIIGFNDTLDAVIGPLNMAAEYVERISRGDVPQKITDSYNGDFNEIKNNLNACIDGLQGLVECNNVLQRMAVNDQTKGVEGEYVGIYASMGEATNNVRARVLNVTNQLNNIAVGDTSQLAGLKKIGKRSEQDRLIPAIIRAMENVNFLIEDTEMLSKAAVEGKLDIRADASKHQGEYRKVVEGINDTLDAVIGPLNVAAEYVERISRGDIPEHITDNYNGDFNEIKNNLNSCIDGMQGLVECNNVLQRMAVNDHTKEVEGEYVGIYASMGEATNKVRDRVLNVTNVLNSISVGDTSRLEELKKIGKRSEQDRLMPAIIRAMENVNLLIEDTELLSKATVEGKLDIRADTARHQGEYRKVVEGINETLDTVIGPLNVAAEYVERIGRGEIPQKITDDYKGDFNEIKNNINNCIDGLQGLVECNQILQRMAVNDQTKRVEGEYLGIYAAMGEATNKVRDRVLNVTNVLENIAIGNTSRLDELKKIGQRSEQDRLMPAIIRAMENVNFLIEDTEMLSKAAVEGKLDIRADASKHQGEYRKVVEGINDTLDAVIGPLNVAAEYVERISRGDIPEHITDNYNGDFNEIKNNLNSCIDGLQGLVECNNVLQRMAVNDQTKGVEGEYVGIYASMGEATNNVRARVLNVTNQLNNIAVGDTSQLAGLKKIGKRSEQDRLMPAIIRAMENVNFLIEDTEMLCKAAVEGKLDIRADASKHQGEYRKIVEGINDTLDAVIGPLNVAAEYVERISRGDIPEHITDNYNGDFNEIKNNLNTCISAINNLIEDSLMLSEASVAGKLETRADSTRHEGDFRKIIEGVNDTLDAVIRPLNDAIKVSNEFSNGNFRARFDENLQVKGDFINFKDVLNNIGISVSDIIKSAKSVTLNVVDCSDEASRGADDVANAAGNVAMSSQKSSELTRELLYKIEGINREIINLSASNEQIASTSKAILSSANEVVRIGKDAQALGKDTNLKMESVEKIAKESVDGISNLTEQIKQIDGIVQLINDITSQINLLSLNAAIEAARAGEHGRGFAVVAGEVKNLATKARNATETIENVVMSVQRDSKKTADAINIANSEIIDGVNSVNKTLDALNTIIKNATQVTQDIGDITKVIDNQVNISVKVVKASEEGNVMTQEVQKEAESLAAIAEETSASVQEIGAAIHEVTDLSNKLKLDMEVFTV